MKNATIRMHDRTFRTEDVALWLLRTVISAAIALDEPIDTAALDRRVLVSDQIGQLDLPAVPLLDIIGSRQQ